MADFTSIVTIICASKEEAETVLAERLGYEEDYGFDYQLSNAPVVAAGDLETLRDFLQDAQDAALGDSNDAEISAWQTAAQYAADLLGVQLP